MMDSASDLTTQSGVSVGTESSITDENPSTSSTLPPGLDIMAALSAISNSKEQGSSMIDQDLLIKILSNPKLVENLVANCGSAGSVSSNASSLYPSSTHEANGVVTTTPASNGQFYPQPMVTQCPPMVYPPPAPSDQHNYGASPARDASYYKNLIQQHGEERQETPPVQQHISYRYTLQPGGPNLEMINSNNNNQRPRDSKPKIMKPCMYFNSTRGCRHGSNCLYQHDATPYQPRNLNNGNINTSEMQSAKRMRFDRD